MATITWVFISQIISLGTIISIKSLPKQTRLLDSLLVSFIHVLNTPRKQHTELSSDHLLNTHLRFGTRTPKISLISWKKCIKEQHAVCGNFASHSEGWVSNMIRSLDWDSLASPADVRPTD